MAKKEDMKEILKKEGIKERMRNRAFELFLKGVPDEEIQKELIVIVPGVSIKEIQQLRRQWEDKTAADREMIGGAEESVGGEETAHVGDIPSSEQKIEPFIPEVELPFIEKKVEERVEYPPSVEKTEYGKENPLPSQKDFVDYLRPQTKGYEEILDKVFGKTRWRHWIRYDEGGFAFPSVEDWVELKKVLNLDDTFDLSETGQIGVFDELKPTEESIEEKIIERETEEKLGERISYENAAADLEKERREIEKLKEELKEDQAHADYVRAKEEYRRAITSEIHAQEVYENAKREISHTEESIREKMDNILSRLDKFDQSVDMLEMMERLQKREPMEEAELKTETAEGRQFEEKISNIGLEKAIEDIVDKSIQKRDMVEEKIPAEEIKKTVEDKEKLEEKTPEILEARNGRVDDIVKDMYRNNVISIEKLSNYLGISVEEAYRLGIERKAETLESTVGEKPVEEVKVISDDTVVKVADALNITVDDARRLIAKKQAERKIDEKLDEEIVTPLDKGKPEEDKTDERFREHSEPEKFYTKVKRYLDIHPYLIVKKEKGLPEVYYMNMKREGILMGIVGGVPAGCLLLYIILLMVGAL